MKQIAILLIIVSLIGCTATQLVTYRPAGSTETSWQIAVNKSASGNTFRLLIDEKLVIEKNTSPVTNSLAARGDYQGSEVIMVVTYNSGFLGIGSGHDVQVFINSELAAKLKL
jgi:hypothetical protein